MAKTLFLYSEMMPYMEAVINSLIEDFKSEVCVVSWDKKRLTPHEPKLLNTAKLYSRSSFDEAELKKLITKFSPNLIYLSGRMDKGYIIAISNINKNIPIVMGMDSQWLGTFKQLIQILLSPFLYKRYFTHMWVPGQRQYVAARLMGYSSCNIISSLYSGNSDLFSKNKLQSKVNKRIVFVGRLEKVKGIDLLLEAWKNLGTNFKNDWKLTLIGSGSFSELASEIEGVEVAGFLEQYMLLDIIQGDCIFCLPSRWEPWGVVVHGMAAAGLPLILSKAVGAGDYFLINGYNGYLLKSLSVNSIKSSLEKMMGLTKYERMIKGMRSRELSEKLNPKVSAASLISILN